MNWIDSLARSLSVKADFPSGAQLYPPRNVGNFGLEGSMFAGPIAFPGWPDRTDTQGVSAAQKPYVSMTSPWFYGNVKAIAGEAGVLELEVGERKSQGKQEELEPVANHPLERIWIKPNPFMGHNFVMQFWVWQMYLFGKAYLYFAPDSRTKELTEMWPVPAAKMKPIGTADKFIDHYEYRVKRDAKPIIIPAEYICYSHFVNPFDPMEGLPPMLAAFNGIETDLAMSKWNANFFGPENAIPTAIATLADTTSDPDFKLIREDLLENFGRGKRKLLVTRGGDINFEVLQFNPEQMMFDKLREISRMEIDRACGLPDGYWTSRANRANSEHADSVIVNTIIWPLGVGLVEDLNAQIIPAHYGEEYQAAFKDVRQRNVAQELQEFSAVTSIYTVAELRMMRPAPAVTQVGWINGDKDDPRNNLLVAQIAQGQGKVEEPAEPEVAKTDETTEEVETEGEVEEEDKEPTEKDATEEVSLEEVTKALNLWRAKSIKRLHYGRGAACAFKSEALPEPVAVRIEGLLATCESAEAVRELFNGIKVVDLPGDGIKYSDDQPRDDSGRFGSGGGGEANSKESRKLTMRKDKMLNSDENLASFKKPARMFHVTTRANAEKIAKQGFKPGTQKTSKEGVSLGTYFSDNAEDVFAKQVDLGLSEDDAVVIEISTAGIDMRLDPEYFTYEDEGATGAKEYIKEVNAKESEYATYTTQAVRPKSILSIKPLFGKRKR